MKSQYPGALQGPAAAGAPPAEAGAPAPALVEAPPAAAAELRSCLSGSALLSVFHLPLVSSHFLSRIARSWLVLGGCPSAGAPKSWLMKRSRPPSCCVGSSFLGLIFRLSSASSSAIRFSKLASFQSAVPIRGARPDVEPDA